MIILTVLAWILVPAALLVYVVRAILHLRKGGNTQGDPNWYVWPFSSATDGVGQLLLALGAALAGITAELALRHFGLSPHAGIILFVVAAGTLALAAWQRAPLVALTGVLFSYSWWGFSVNAWNQPLDASSTLSAGVGVMVLSVLAIGAARLLEANPADKRLAFFGWLPGSAAAVAGLFVLSSQDVIVELSGAHTVGPFAMGWKPALVLGILFALASATLAFAAWRKATSLAETTVLAVVLGVMLALAVWPPRGAASGGTEFGIFGLGGTATLTPVGTMWAAIFNAVLLAVLLGLVFLGYQRREDWLVTSGALLLFVFVLFKYFDWLFSLLDRSIAFVGAGLLFLGVGWLMERGRRSILAAMEADHERP